MNFEANHVYTDGGRAEAGFPNEQKDCTVRALAIARKLPYAVAHDILARMGRPPRKGFRFHKVATSQGFTEHVQPRRGRMRVRTAVKKFNKGRFIFRVSRHVLAVIDGVTYDKNVFDTIANCIVTHVWEVAVPLTP